jgi:acyl carrier protein
VTEELRPEGAWSERTILAALAQIAREHLQWEGTLALETELVPTLRLDSIRLLTLVVEVENRFQICLDEGDEDDLVTAADLVRLIESRQ